MFVTGLQLARTAREAYEQYRNVSIPARSGGSSPSGLDPGGFVKYCFAQCNVPIHIKGTNDLFRQPFTWRDTLEASRKAGMIVDGALAFIVLQDGGEKKRGYRDGLGNSICTGIVSNNMVLYYSGDRQAIIETRINSTTRKDWWSHFMHIGCVSY